MELDEEELIEQEFDNICNKIFSINSLIDIYEKILNEKSRKYETKQKEINQLFKKSYGFKPSKFEIINLVENKIEVSLNRKKITYDDLKDNKALYKILLDDSPLKAKIDLNKIIELMTSEIKAYLIDIIDNSIVIDPDKTKESVYEQLLTSSSKIENFFSGKAKLKLYELDNNKNIVLIWQKINQRIKEIVIPYLKCTLLDDNLSEATKKTLIQLKTLYTVIIQNKFNDFDFIYNSVTDNDTKEEIIKRYEAKYKKKISNDELNAILDTKIITEEFKKEVFKKIEVKNSDEENEEVENETTQINQEEIKNNSRQEIYKKYNFNEEQKESFNDLVLESTNNIVDKIKIGEFKEKIINISNKDIRNRALEITKFLNKQYKCNLDFKDLYKFDNSLKSMNFFYEKGLDITRFNREYPNVYGDLINISNELRELKNCVDMFIFTIENEMDNPKEYIKYFYLTIILSNVFGFKYDYKKDVNNETELDEVFKKCIYRNGKEQIRLCNLIKKRILPIIDLYKEYSEKISNILTNIFDNNCDLKAVKDIFNCFEKAYDFAIQSRYTLFDNSKLKISSDEIKQEIYNEVLLRCPGIQYTGVVNLLKYDVEISDACKNATIEINKLSSEYLSSKEGKYEYLWCHNDLDKKLKTYTDIYVLIIKFVKCYSSVFGETTLNKDKTLLNNLSDALNRLDNIITDYAYSYFAKKVFLAISIGGNNSSSIKSMIYQIGTTKVLEEMYSKDLSVSESEKNELEDLNEDIVRYRYCVDKVNKIIKDLLQNKNTPDLTEIRKENLSNGISIFSNYIIYNKLNECIAETKNEFKNSKEYCLYFFMRMVEKIGGYNVTEEFINKWFKNVEESFTGHKKIQEDKRTMKKEQEERARREAEEKRRRVELEAQRKKQEEEARRKALEEEKRQEALRKKRLEEERKRKEAERIRLEQERKRQEEQRRLEQERQKKEVEAKNLQMLKERYLTLMTYTIREFRDCMGYDVAQKEKNLAKNQNYLDLLDYIHNKLGITSHEARDYLNEETGDYIVHRMTSFFTPEKDWQLGSLYNEFRKNTLAYNRLCERGDECNQSILYVKYRSLYRMIVVNISKRLSIDEESAMKLVSETGELYGAARIDSILYNEDIRDLREKLKSAKKEYDDYLAADWDGRQAMVPQILQWKLADVRKKASNTINRLGYITACEIFVAACKELKADVKALEKLLEMQIKR